MHEDMFVGQTLKYNGPVVFVEIVFLYMMKTYSITHGH